MRAPVSAVFITRDDAGLEDAIASVRPYVEDVVVVDTAPGAGIAASGSVAGVPYKPQPKGPTHRYVCETCNDADGRIADFGHARNVGIRLATQPWILTLDADDILEGGEHLAEVIREADRSRKGSPVRIFARYEYAYDAEGDCCLEQWVPRLVPRGTHEWRGKVHEELTPLDRNATTTSRSRAFFVRHRRQYLPTRDGDAGRNLRILEANPDDSARYALHLGSELSILGQVCTDAEEGSAFDARAVDHLVYCIAESDLPDEQAEACLKLGDVELRIAIRATEQHEAFFDVSNAESALVDALRVCPHVAQPYLSLARLAYASASAGHISDAERLRRFERVIHWGRLALELPNATIAHDPTQKSYWVHTYMADAHAQLGQLDAALASVERALQSKPTSQHMAYVKKAYAAQAARVRILADADVLRRAAGIDDASYEFLTSAIQEPAALKARIRALAEDDDEESSDADGPLTIVFACGPSFEPWNPDILRDRGLGGSETATIAMAKRLAAKGHTVRVYGTVGEEMTRDGVSYLRSGKLFASPPCDVLIVSRNAALLEPGAGPLSARLRILWVHDVEPANFTPGRALLADAVFALSAWHRQHLIEACDLHPDQVIQTRNGIDLARFDGDAPARTPHKAIYSSSADRGLAILVGLWPTIRKRVPDAELHVFYGFDTWRAAVEWRADPESVKEIANLEAACKATEGIVLRGRVPQDELAREMRSAGAWLHPSWTKDGPFFETSCIGAMEAQAAGCFVVAGNRGALTETADAFGAVLLDQGEDWGVVIAAALYEGGILPGDRPRIASEAARFSWDGLEDEWLAIFRRRLAGDLSLLPPYVGLDAAAE